MSKTTLTTSAGAPVADDNNSITAGPRGSLTYDNHYTFEKLAHFNRERIPERVVHARGTGAYGTFTVTKKLSDYTIADFFQQEGQQTEVFVRFSTVGGGQDSHDFARDPRGFAVKFYSREGNYDMVGNNTPVFFLRDPIKFPDFIHSQKKNPRTNTPDPAAAFEFWANHPQSLHQMTILMSDRGIPASYRHMHGFSSHTYSFWNKDGERVWFKWHFKSNQGIKNLSNEEAAMAPPYGAQEDLVSAIDNGDYPSWTAKVQIMTEQEARDYKINPFDLTKVWPHKDFPLIEVGQLELNRNVQNYFAETEQAAFAPSNLVPGIGASPDKMLQGRLLAYQDAHRYRIGVNFNQLPVNAAKCPVNHYQRDGAMAGLCPAGGNHHQSNGANYYPNDRINDGAPAPVPRVAEPPMPLEADAWQDRYDTTDEDHYSQAGALFRLMNEDQKNQLADSIAGGLSQANESIQQRMLAQFGLADPDYAERVKSALTAIN
ncbi:catalase [Methylophaga sp. OBS4]|uniref:catalase n=1 Tax=Methylophaga sp. OBS4 TaxID=2991935 RepID=UPI00224CC2A9|nr:catalase [Methylophaga sp. OBS4]MCX4187257.1 catalase [Methylophaga sp. OBS4]